MLHVELVWFLFIWWKAFRGMSQTFVLSERTEAADVTATVYFYRAERDTDENRAAR